MNIFPMKFELLILQKSKKLIKDHGTADSPGICKCGEKINNMDDLHRHLSEITINSITRKDLMKMNSEVVLKEQEKVWITVWIEVEKVYEIILDCRNAQVAPAI